MSDDFGRVWTSQPDDPELRESVNAWIWDDSGSVGLPRIGIEAVADQWDTHDLQINVAFADGRVFNLLGPGAVHDPAGGRVLGAGPQSFELDGTFGRWRMRIDGHAHTTSVANQIGGEFPGVGDLVPIQAEIDLVPAAPPWMNGDLRPEAKHILETQEEGWLMGHPWRFEQLGRSSGWLRIDGVEHRIAGGANRIRRQSIRRTASLWGHAWQAAIFPSGRGFAYITYPPRQDGKATYNEGHVVLADGGALVPARAVDPPWLSSLAPGGQDVSVRMATDDGTVHEIHGTTEVSTFMVMPKELAGGLQLQQAICHYTWDGETALGMIERSIAPESLG